MYSPQNRSQPAPADGPGFIRDGEAMLPDSPRVHIAHFHSLLDLNPVAHDSSENPADPGFDGISIYFGDDLSFFHQIADLPSSPKPASRGSAQDSFQRIPGNFSGNARVRIRLSFFDHHPQPVPPIGFNDHVDMLSSPEARAKADDQGGIAEAGSRVPLGQDGIDHYLRLQFFPDGGRRVHDYTDIAFSPGTNDLLAAGGAFGRQAFYFFLPFQDGLAKGHLAAYSQGLGDFSYANPETGTGQAMSHARGHLSSPFDQDDQFF